MTCPCGLTRLEFKLWNRGALLQGSRWNIEIAAMDFALFPASCDIPSPWHLSANQSDGQLTRWEQRWGPLSRFVLVGLVAKEVEWHLGAWTRSTLLKWCPVVYFCGLNHQIKSFYPILFHSRLFPSREHVLLTTVTSLFKKTLSARVGGKGSGG